MLEGELEVEYDIWANPSAHIPVVPGNYSFNITTVSFITLYLPHTYKNGIITYVSNKTVGSFGFINQVNLPKPEPQNDLSPESLVYIWLRELLPFILIGLVLVTILIIIKFRKYTK